MGVIIYSLIGNSSSLYSEKVARRAVCLLLVLVSLLFGTNIFAATTYYISPLGNDSNDGRAKTSAWKTFAHSFTVLGPGDTLIITNGIYNEPIIPTASGRDGQPITLKAETIGGAIIQMVKDGSAIEIYSNTMKTISYITIDGLLARGHGEYPTISVYSSDAVTEPQMTNHIVIRNTGAFGSANFTNTVNINVGNNARDCLFEDIWAYGFGRKALQVFGCFRVTVRRAVLRYDYWDGSSYKPNDPRVNFSGYNVHDSIFENIIALDGAPTPPGRSADRAGIVASGNETPAIISGSKNNKYLGLISINNYGNGYNINGGTGSPNVGMYFKDIIAWDNKEGYGLNIHDNDMGGIYSFMTIGEHRGQYMSGIRINPNPAYIISNEVIRNSYSYHNYHKGLLYNPTTATVTETSATDNGYYGSDLETQYAPTIKWLPRPTMVPGHPRGATLEMRYVDGVLTSSPLWPWPNENLIQQTMCDPADLAAAHRVASEGTDWEPGWCASGKTLTRYIWEYLGNSIPDDVYGNVPIIRTIHIQ